MCLLILPLWLKYTVTGMGTRDYAENQSALAPKLAHIAVSRSTAGLLAGDFEPFLAAYRLQPHRFE